jgi:hypothetical protein
MIDLFSVRGSHSPVFGPPPACPHYIPAFPGCGTGNLAVGQGKEEKMEAPGNSHPGTDIRCNVNPTGGFNDERFP